MRKILLLFFVFSFYSFLFSYEEIFFRNFEDSFSLLSSIDDKSIILVNLDEILLDYSSPWWKPFWKKISFKLADSRIINFINRCKEKGALVFGVTEREILFEENYHNDFCNAIDEAGIVFTDLMNSSPYIDNLYTPFTPMPYDREKDNYYYYSVKGKDIVMGGSFFSRGIFYFDDNQYYFVDGGILFDCIARLLNEKTLASYKFFIFQPSLEMEGNAFNFLHAQFHSSSLEIYSVFFKSNLPLRKISRLLRDKRVFYAY